jgi:hypothetical protein
MDKDRMVKVTVFITQHDYENITDHYVRDKAGRPLVAVHKIVCPHCGQEGEPHDPGEIFCLALGPDDPLPRRPVCDECNADTCLCFVEEGE